MSSASLARSAISSSVTWSGSRLDRVLAASTNWYFRLYWRAISFNSSSWVCRLFLKNLSNKLSSRGLFCPSLWEAGSRGVTVVEVVVAVLEGLGRALTVEVVVMDVDVEELLVRVEAG